MYNKNNSYYNSDFDKAIESNRIKNMIKSKKDKVNSTQEKSSNIKDIQDSANKFIYYLGSQNDVVLNNSDSVKIINTMYRDKVFDPRKVNTKQSENITKALTMLKDVNFFSIVNNSNNGNQSAIEQNSKKIMLETVDLNYKSMDNIRATVSVTQLEKQYQNLKKVSADGGYIIGFDTETIGAVTDKIWSPDTITEFAMRVDNMTNGNVDETNVLLTSLVDHETRLKQIENILSQENGLEVLMANEDLKITAQRYSLYGHKDTVVKYDKAKGYYAATSIADSDKVRVGNVEQMRKGVENITGGTFVNGRLTGGNKIAIDPETGLHKDVSTVLKSLEFMSKQSNSGNAMILSYNGQTFDEPVLNKYIKTIYDSQLSIINNKSKTIEEIEQAKKGIYYITNTFGNNPSLNLNNDYVFDVYPAFRLGVDLKGEHNFYKKSTNGSQALNNSNGKYYRQEVAAEAFYTSILNEGSAHNALSDTRVLNAFATTAMENIKGGQNTETLLDYVMSTIKTGTKDNAQHVVNPNQIYMSTFNNKASTDGKKIFHFMQDSKGQIITSTNHIVDAKGNISYNKILSESPTFEKNQFFKIIGQNKIDISQLPTEFSTLAPEFGFSNMYTLQLELMHSDKYQGTEASKVINMMFGNKNEMEAWVSSNLTHVGEMKKNKTFDPSIDLNELTIRQFNNGKAIKNSSFYKKASAYDVLQRAMETTEENIINRRVNNSFLNSNDAAKKISGLLDFNNWAKHQGGSAYNSIDFARLYFDDNAATNYELLPQHIANIKQNLVQNLGYKSDKKLKMNDTLLNSTAKNALFAYDNVNSQNEFYTNLLNFVYDDLGIKINKKGYRETYDNLDKTKKTLVNERFNLLMSQSNEYISNNGNIDINKIVKNKKQLLTEKDFKTKYDFRLNGGFFAETKSSNIINHNLNDYSNVVTFDLSNTNSRKNFVDQLLRTKYDNVKKFNEYEKDIYSKSVIYDFVNNISENDNKTLFKNKKFKKLRNVVSNGDYDLTYATMLLEESIADTKNLNMNNGLIKTSDISGRVVAKEIVEARNKLNENDFKKMANNLPTIIDANKDKGAVDKQIKKLMEKFYIPNRDDYVKEISHLDPVTQKANLILYDNLNKQVNGMMHEIFSAAGYSDLAIQYDNKTGILNLVSGTKAIPLKGMPKIKSENGQLYISTATQNFQAKHTLRTVMDKNQHYLEVGTNIDKVFGEDGTFFDDIKRAFDKGTFDLDTFSKKLGYYRKELSDSPTISNFTPYDMVTSNSTVDTTGAHEILPFIFKPDGPYRQMIIDKIKSGELNTPEAVKVFTEKIPDDLKGDVLSPTLQMLGIVDNPIIYEMLAKDPNSKFIIRNMNTMGKETKVTESQFTVGPGKIITSTNLADNLGRPTVMSAGNTRWLKCNDIREARKKYEGLLIEGHAISSKDITGNIYRHVKQTEMDYVNSFSHRQLYTGVLGIESLLHNERSRVLNNFITKDMSAEESQRIKNLYNTVSDYLKDSVYEQAKLLDPLLVEQVAGQIPQDIQKISVNTNSVPYLNSVLNDKKELEKLEKNSKIKEMIETLGTVSVAEDGTVSYNKGKSTLVKHGDLILPYQSYGNNIEYVTTKHNHGVLNFAIRDLENNELTTNEINKIINKNKHLFTGDEHDDMQAFIGIFERNNFKMGYEIENINKSELIKTSDNAAEKSMSRLWYGKTGEFDDDLVKYFKSTNGENLLYSTVLSDKAIDAYAADVERRHGHKRAQELLEKAGMKSIDELKAKIAIEQFTYRNMIFDNEKGILKGVSGVANDNLIGHKNEGARLMATIGEAVSLVGKHQNGGIEDSKSYENGLNTVIDFINKGNGKYDFLGESKDGQISGANGKRTGYTVNNFSLMYNRIISNEDFNYIDGKKLKNLIKDLNDEYLKNAPEEDRLYYENIKVLTKPNTYENIEEYYGHLSYITDPVTGDKVAIGSKGVVNKAINHDSETQSSVTKEYLDRKAHIMTLKDEREAALEKLEVLKNSGNARSVYNQEKKIEHLNEKIGHQVDVVNAMGQHSNPMKIDDQARTLLSNSRLNDTTEKRLNLWVNTKDKDKFHNLISQGTGGMISANENGDLVINELVRSDNVNEKILSDIKGQITYNPLTEKKLTEEMTTSPKYEKYKELFYRAERMNMELGVDHAEQYYQGIRAVKAAQFNNGSKVSMDTLIDDYGFKMINIENYASTMGRADNPVLENLSKQAIIVDLGEDFDESIRYFAVPGLGGKSGDKEIRQEWHQKMNKISHIHKEYMEQQGAESDYVSRLYNNISVAVNQLREDTDNLLAKGSMFGDMSKVEVNMPYVRSKLLSTVSESTIDTPLTKNIRNSLTIEDDIHSSSFKHRALINGRTIADWEKEGIEGTGIYFDYRVAGKKAFQDAGYFDDKFMTSMGFKAYTDANGNVITQQDQMMDYLRTHGTMDIVDRYPNIKEKSLSTTRVFLDTNMVGDNETLLAAHTMINANGDSDGDSISALFLQYKGTNYAQYNKERMAAEKTVRSQIKKSNKDYSDFEIEKMIKEKTIMSSKNVDVDAYDLFRGKEIEMTYRAVENRNTIAESILPSFYKESERNYKNLGVYTKVDGKESNLMAQVVGGKSILGDIKLYAQEQHITSGYLIDSNKKISEHMQLAYNIFNDENRNFDLDGYKYIQKMKDVANIHEFGNKQTEALDEVLAIIKTAGDNKFSGITKEVYGSIEKDVLSRVRANTYIENSISKAGKSAIGQVNASLYAIKQASEEYFGREGLENSNPLARQIIFSMSDKIEENIISYKKVQAVAGDMRLIDFNDIMADARYNKNPGFNRLPGGNGDDLIKWTSKYITEDVTDEIYKNLNNNKLLNDKLRNDVAIYTKSFLGAGFKKEEAEHLAKSRMLTEQYMQYVTELYNDKGAMANVETYSNIGRRSSSILNVVNFEKGSDVSHNNAVLSLLFEKDMNMAKESLKSNNYEGVQRITDFAKDTLTQPAKNKITEKILEDGVKAIGSINSSGLTTGAIGLAAGLAISGFAGGNPLNNANPQEMENDNNPNIEAMSVPNFFDSHGGYVTGNSQRGYVINVKADTDKGQKHMKRAMKEAIKSAAGNSVSINMNFKSNNSGGYSDQDIEKMISNYI